MTKVEAVVIRERIETVIDAVEEEAGHVGVTVIEAVGHGRQRGVTHEYRGRVFESRFLPKALLVFIVADEQAGALLHPVVDPAGGGDGARGGPALAPPGGAGGPPTTGRSLQEGGSSCRRTTRAAR